MKNCISIFLIGFILFNTSNLTFADISNQEDEIPEKVILPEIPIYIQGNYSYFESDKFISVSNSNSSFYKIKISFQRTNYRKEAPKNLKAWIFWSTISGCLTGLYVDYLNKISKDLDYIDEWDPSEEANPKEAKMKLTWTLSLSTVGCLLGLAIPYSQERQSIPITDEYNLSLNKQNKVIKITNVTLNYKDIINSISIINFIDKSDENLRNWDRLYLLCKEYNSPLNISSIKEIYDDKISKLGKLKGEFENTFQYEDRLRKEKIEKNEIETEYQQQLKLAKEQSKLEKIELLREIQKKINNFQFEKNYSFMLSDYNADKQEFTLIIPTQNWSRKIIVSMDEAKEFKSKQSQLAIKQIVKPTLNGKWQPAYDDYLLFNMITNEIIPWDTTKVIYVEKLFENPPSLKVEVDLIEPSGEGYLDAGEQATIKVILQNDGLGSAKNTRVSLKQKEGTTLYYDVSKTINEIKPNESKEVSFNINVPESIDNGDVIFQISFLEEQGFEPSPITFTAETRAILPPQLELVDFGLEDYDANGKLSKGESAEITARIQNQGQGKAKNVIARIITNPIQNVFLAPYSEDVFSLGDFSPGESKDIKFTIVTNKRTDERVTIKLNFEEYRINFSKDAEIIIELEKEQRQLEPLVFVGKDVEKEIPDVSHISIDIEQNIPKCKKLNKDAVAVVIGNRNYTAGDVPPVEFAKRDANYVKEYLINTLGYREGNIIYVTNASQADFNSIFGTDKNHKGKLYNYVKSAQSDIFIYYSGHGAPDTESKNGYFVPVDCDPSLVSLNGYSLNTFYDNLSKIDYKSLTVVIDACFSGSSEGGMLLKDLSPIFIEVDNPVTAKGNSIVFTSATGKQVSSWYSEKKHSLFTYYFLKALQGEADKNNDNKLTIGEIKDYIDDNVPYMARRLNNREQTPQVIGSLETIIVEY